MSCYLIKRNPSFSKKGVLIKRNILNKVFSEVSFNNRFPSSKKLEINDTIYVSETDYGIYAYGKISKIDNIETFKSIEKLIKYCDDNKIKDFAYWHSILIKFARKKKEKQNSVLRFQKYYINQKLLERVIPLRGKLSKLRRFQGICEISDHVDEIKNLIKNPKRIERKKLEIKIPNSLRFNLYSLFNQKYKISTIIDIDHFVPKSIGGPGNIPENLVPVGFALNRYKSDSIPKGLFIVANKNEELRKFVKSEYIKSKKEFISKQDHKLSKDDAIKIIDKVKKMEFEKSIIFFRNVLQYHHPSYLNLIDLLYKNNS